jgi:predicted transcriptional regulator
MNQDEKRELLELTTEIVSSYFSNNSVAVEDVPATIERVFSSLVGLSQGDGAVAVRPQPAVAIEDSVTPDYIICLEDGKQLKMLKRYLMTAHGLTPDEYRERWGLPADYPMVAPNYAEKRSELAKNIGLGKRS